MTIGLLFWVLYIVGFIFYGYRNWGTTFPDSLFWWVLIALLGIQVFGWPIKG